MIRMRVLKFHILFWLFIAFYIFDYFIVEYSLVESLRFTIFEITLFTIAFYINLYILLPALSKQNGYIKYITGLIFLWTVIYSIYWIIGYDSILLSEDLFRSFISFFLNHALFIFISFLVWNFENYQKAKQKAWELEKEKLNLKMLLLKSQVTPHFFFNTLNNIYALSLLKSDDAPTLIALLSDLMRYFVYDGSKEEVELKQEMIMLNKYLEIQQLRDLKGTSSLDFQHLDLSLKFPPLLLITLVENAFKHGDIQEEANGYVRIEMFSVDKEITFSVQNSYIKKDKKKGIGLQNFKAQVEVLFGLEYDLQIIEEANCFTTILKVNGK
jgi:sensor histidine kinase YesM